MITAQNIQINLFNFETKYQKELEVNIIIF